MRYLLIYSCWYWSLKSQQQCSASQSKDGLHLRNILPRALSFLVGNLSQDKLAIQMDRLLSGIQEGGDRDEQLDEIVDLILNGEQNSAQQNISRLRTLERYFADLRSSDHGRAIEMLIEPLEHITNKLFKRTGLISVMQNHPCPEKSKEAAQESLVSHLSVAESLNVSSLIHTVFPSIH